MTSDTKYLNHYMLGGIYAIFVLILWYFSCLAIEQTFIPKYWQIFSQLVLTLTATFIGAYLAFAYRVREKKDEIMAHQVECLNNAIIALARQKSLMEGIRNTVINRKSKRENLDSDSIELIQLKLTMPQGGKSYVDINKLTFLVESNNGKLVKELINSENKFNELITLIDSNNAYYINEILPKYNTNKVSFSELNDRISPKEIHFKNETIGAIKQINDVLNALQIEAKKLFPTAVFILF